MAGWLWWWWHMEGGVGECSLKAHGVRQGVAKQDHGKITCGLFWRCVQRLAESLRVKCLLEGAMSGIHHLPWKWLVTQQQGCLVAEAEVRRRHGWVVWHVAKMGCWCTLLLIGRNLSPPLTRARGRGPVTLVVSAASPTQGGALVGVPTLADTTVGTTGRGSVSLTWPQSILDRMMSRWMPPVEGSSLRPIGRRGRRGTVIDPVDMQQNLVA
jgi:hypothetical protein